MIRADCRDKFTDEDHKFVISTLAKSESSRTALAELLNDPDSRDQILDQPTLFEHLQQQTTISSVSPFLFFYLMTRQSLLAENIDDYQLSDYLASMLAAFSESKRLHTIAGGHDKEYHYLVDMVLDSVDTSSVEAFFVRAHLGNYALFTSSIFPDHLFNKSTYGRRTVGVDYYEQMGKMSYRIASQHRLAKKYNISDILAYLSDCFQLIRRMLSRLADQFLVLDNGGTNLDKILRQLFYDRDNPGRIAA